MTTTAVRRGTSMGDSDVHEVVSLNKALISGWVVSANIGVNATAISVSLVWASCSMSRRRPSR